MTIDEILKASQPYSGRKYENMTVLQRLRCDLFNEAADYDHVMLHAWTPYRERQARKEIGDELVKIAQDYAWRYRNHKMIEFIDELLETGHGGGNWRRLLISKRAKIESDLKEYQQQFKNMELI